MALIVPTVPRNYSDGGTHMKSISRVAAALVLAVAVAAPVAAAQAGDDNDPVVTHDRVREVQPIPHRTVTRKTATLKKGVTKVAQRGRDGVRVKVFRLTLEDGVLSSRTLVSSTVKRKPVTRVILKGTRVSQPARRCDPNYSGCVPIAYDVDCAGGSGDGPAYVQGPVRVIGTDIYDLDYDNDGWGCE
ncbi:hypothetical protein GCM10009795_042020 [Nocardioides hankookensis]|uniref:G5 domain-containing protein n=1 Tax=Nocardioides hankookensis TaxID=443157 RepID=A0ABW1LNR5_9ACTN